MIIVTVARKPLSEGTVTANVLQHGTGALNIDGTRIASDGSHMVGVVRATGKGTKSQVYNDPLSVVGFVPTNHPGGRWPANLILEHKPECRMVGHTQAGSGKFVGPEDVRRTSEMMTPAKGWNANSLDNSKKNAPNSYGTEIVEAWECAPGCPIAHLDATTSASVTGGRSPTSQAAKVEGTTWGTDNHKSREYPNETGSVSRFFKQIQK